MVYSPGIKSNSPSEVNSRLRARIALSAAALAVSLGWPASFELRAEELPTAPIGDPAADPSSTSNSPADPTAPLPAIQARDFAVKIVRASRSGKTYLIEDVDDAKTRAGKILLLRREGESVMAFRVVKLYSDKKQFAAKQVRTYGSITALKAGDPYAALEKVGDVAIPPPTAQDKADLKELESAPPTAPGPEVKAFDQDLDAGTSPPPSGAVDSENSKAHPHEELEDEGEPQFGVTVEEVNVLDPNSQWLTASFGYFNNSGSYFAGGGLRYGLSLGRMVFLRRAHAQDSIAVEAGAFFYKIINFQSQGDAYSVVPLVGTLRYNILFSENFGIFFYGGVVQNFVTEVSSGNEEDQAKLQTILPAAGAGLLFRVGPNWYTRVDMGYDMVGLGLTLRF